MTIMKPRPETRDPKSFAPEERSPLRKLHNEIRLAELAGEEDELAVLLDRAPAEYRAAYALVAFLPRALLAEDPAEDYAPWDVPDAELDAIEAENTADEDATAAEESDAGGVEPDAATDSPEVENETAEATQPEGPANWTELRDIRDRVIAAATAEKRAAKRASTADRRLAHLRESADVAEREANEAAAAAKAAAHRATDALSTRHGTRAAQRASTRFAELAAAQELAVEKKRLAQAAQARADRAQRSVISRAQKTMLIIARANSAYELLMAQPGRARTGRAPTPAHAPANIADEDDEGPAGPQHRLLLFRSTGSSPCSEQRPCIAKPRRKRGPHSRRVPVVHGESRLNEEVSAFLAAPSIEGVAAMDDDSLIELVTNWQIRERVATWMVCDGQHPAPPWVRAREWGVLELRWRAQHGELPRDMAALGNHFALPDGRLITLRPVERCGELALSVRDLVDELGGDQMSGHQRDTGLIEVNAGLESFYEVARAQEATDEAAAAMLLHMVARDETYEPPPWLRELFDSHREGLQEIFCRPDDHRQIEYASIDDEPKTPACRRPAAISRSQLREIAALYMRGRVAEAAELAGKTPAQLRDWREARPDFQIACAHASRKQAIVAVAS